MSTHCNLDHDSTMAADSKNSETCSTYHKTLPRFPVISVLSPRVESFLSLLPFFVSKNTLLFFVSPDTGATNFSMFSSCSASLFKVVRSSLLSTAANDAFKSTLFFLSLADVKRDRPKHEHRRLEKT